MLTTKISSKGQIVIPKAIRDRLKIASGTFFNIRLEKEDIVLTPTKATAIAAPVEPGKNSARAAQKPAGIMIISLGNGTKDDSTVMKKNTKKGPHQVIIKLATCSSIGIKCSVIFPLSENTQHIFYRGARGERRTKKQSISTVRGKPSNSRRLLDSLRTLRTLRCSFTLTPSIRICL